MTTPAPTCRSDGSGPSLLAEYRGFDSLLRLCVFLASSGFPATAQDCPPIVPLAFCFLKRTADSKVKSSPLCSVTTCAGNDKE